MIHDDLIYDVGMNSGQDTEFYLRKGFRVVAVEANPILAKEVSTRLHQAVASGRLHVLNFGIARSAGQLPFYVNETHHEWSSLDLTLGSRGGKYHEISVPVATLASVIRAYGMPRYLKIDIEGSDLLALKALHEFSERPPFAGVETGPNTQWIHALYELGYRRFALVDQQKVIDTICPNPPREGLAVDWKFEWGSSGLFGEELPYPWLDYATAIREWDKIVATTSAVGSLIWYDIHARLQQ